MASTIRGLIVRVIFGNFAKIGRTAGASPIWQISKHHEWRKGILSTNVK
jgi:hypothetical protein